MQNRLKLLGTSDVSACGLTVYVVDFFFFWQMFDFCYKDSWCWNKFGLICFDFQYWYVWQWQDCWLIQHQHVLWLMSLIDCSLSFCHHFIVNTSVCDIIDSFILWIRWLLINTTIQSNSFCPLVHMSPLNDVNLITVSVSEKGTFYQIVAAKQEI